MKNKGRFGQHSQKPMVALAAWTTRVITLGRPLLPTFSVEDRRIQIERETALRLGQQAQQTGPERPPKGLNARLGEMVEKPPDRILAREACDPPASRAEPCRGAATPRGQNGWLPQAPN
jgi:hypothetical protein